MADDWLDFMLSQRNLWPTLTTKGASAEMVTEQTLRKERRRLQAKHLWIDIKVTWDILYNRTYTEAPTGMSREQLYDLLFNRAARSNRKNPYEEKEYRGPYYRAVREKWEQNQQWMRYYKHHRAPLVMDVSGIIHAFQGKDQAARTEIDTYMDYCAKRWQTREGTYQLKRRRLLPDVRDPPEQGDEDVNMTDI